VSEIREFETGATRHVDQGKLDYARFNDPMVEKLYAEYLQKHRVQADGKLREPDNWKKGIPEDVYLSSLYRHLHDVWLHMHGYSGQATESMLDSLCGARFNLNGLIYEIFAKEKKDEWR